MNLPKILGVIPSRYASTRLAGKPLLDICGKPMVEHVYRRAVASGVFFRVVIATDDERIYSAAEKFGGDVLMTKADHPDGSSRVAEVARSIDADYVINIQGDEPMLDPRMLRELAEGIVSDPGADSATVCVPIKDDKDFFNPNIVKVVTDQRGRALYFSRSPIPFMRNDTECPMGAPGNICIHQRIPSEIRRTATDSADAGRVIGAAQDTGARLHHGSDSHEIPFARAQRQYRGRPAGSQKDPC